MHTHPRRHTETLNSPTTAMEFPLVPIMTGEKKDAEQKEWQTAIICERTKTAAQRFELNTHVYVRVCLTVKLHNVLTHAQSKRGPTYTQTQVMSKRINETRSRDRKREFEWEREKEGNRHRRIKL